MTSANSACDSYGNPTVWKAEAAVVRPVSEFTSNKKTNTKEDMEHLFSMQISSATTENRKSRKNKTAICSSNCLENRYFKENSKLKSLDPVPNDDCGIIHTSPDTESASV